MTKEPHIDDKLIRKGKLKLIFVYESVKLSFWRRKCRDVASRWTMSPITTILASSSLKRSSSQLKRSTIPHPWGCMERRIYPMKTLLKLMQKLLESVNLPWQPKVATSQKANFEVNWNVLRYNFREMTCSCFYWENKSIQVKIWSFL